MSLRNILITGGAGFIGSHLVERLLGEGDWRITVVDDFNDFYSPAIKRENISAHLSHPNFTLIEADIRDAEALASAFDDTKYDCLVHLAARAGVRPSLKEPRLYVETNVNGTVNLLELARAHGVKQFVFGSSSSVYGVNPKVPFSEDDPNLQSDLAVRCDESRRRINLSFVFASLRHANRLPAILHRVWCAPAT